MTTQDIVDFLNARLDEDEQVARAATARQPSIPRDVPRGTWTFDDDEDKPRVQGISSGCVYTAQAEMIHIARHDPARVLREVEAKRRILARHCKPHENSPWGSWWAELQDSPQPCIGCGFGGACDDPWTEDINDCPELCDLAAIYSDHPDYRQEWA